MGLARAHRRRPHQPRLRAAAPGRHARAEGALPGADGPGPGHRRLRPDRAGAGSDSGGTRTTARRGRRRRRLLGHRRPQAVHHQRRPGGHVHRHGADRRATTAIAGDQRLHRPGRHARLQRRPARGQDGPARRRHRRAALRGLPRPGRRTCSGKQGDGWRTFLKILDGGRISIGAHGRRASPRPRSTRRSRTRRRASSSAGRSARSRASRS